MRSWLRLTFLAGTAAVAGWIAQSIPARAACDCPEAACTGTSASYEAPSSAAANIAFRWEGDRPCGRYANGDVWVVGPVKLKSMTPLPSGGRHGWIVNPRWDQQGFDERIRRHYTAPPALPQTIPPGSSVVKAASKGDGKHPQCYRANKQRTCLQFAAVLTVVDRPPAAPRDTFRPPWAGTAKPERRVSSLKLERLPKLPTAGVPSRNRRYSLERIAKRWRWPQLQHMARWQGIEEVAPDDNLGEFVDAHPGYGADVLRDSGNSALRFLLADFDASRPEQRAALVNYVQAGIDIAAQVATGGGFDQDHQQEPLLGIFNGRKLPVVFAARLLGDAELARIGSSEDWSENDQVYHSPKADGGRGLALYGEPLPGVDRDCTEANYWVEILDRKTRNPNCRDPYGYVDGSTQATKNYALRTAPGFGYAALAVKLLRAEAVWSDADFLAFAARWRTVGRWTKPDPCALQRPAKLNGVCVPGTGRWPDEHGRHRPPDGWSDIYMDPLGEEMWKEFHATAFAAPVPAPQAGLSGDR